MRTEKVVARAGYGTRRPAQKDVERGYDVRRDLEIPCDGLIALAVLVRGQVLDRF